MMLITLDSSTGRTNCGGGTIRGRGRGLRRPSFNKTLVECFYCHDLGDFQYECPKKNKGKESQAHFAKKPLLLLAYVEEMVKQKEDSTDCLSEIEDFRTF